MGWCSHVGGVTDHIRDKVRLERTLDNFYFFRKRLCKVTLSVGLQKTNLNVTLSKISSSSIPILQISIVNWCSRTSAKKRSPKIQLFWEMSKTHLGERVCWQNNWEGLCWRIIPNLPDEHLNDAAANSVEAHYLATELLTLVHGVWKTVLLSFSKILISERYLFCNYTQIYGYIFLSAIVTEHCNVRSEDLAAPLFWQCTPKQILLVLIIYQGLVTLFAAFV